MNGALLYPKPRREVVLESRVGDAYREYAARVPRWWPVFHHRGHRPDRTRGDHRNDTSDPRAFSWRETLFSERGTLVAIALGYVLIWLKLRT